MNKKTYLLKQGQALLFVVVAMTIALALGLSVSSRTISTISRVSQTDTSARVRAVAEAGAEHFLAKSPQELDDLTDKAPSTITFDTEDSTGDKITAEATVSVSQQNNNYMFDGSTPAVNYNVEKGTISQYLVPSTVGSLVRVCYRPNNAASPNSALYVVLYNLGDPPAVVRKFGFVANSGPNFDEFDTFNGSTDSSYRGCAIVNTAGSGVMRVMSLLDDVTVGVVGNNLPSQVYKIVSVGTLQEAGTAQATAEVTVYKSELFSPAPLDFAIYSQNSGWTF